MKPKPFLKWAGGKSRLASRIIARMPRNVGSYVEPFLGAGAVYLSLRPERSLLIDVNKHLIRCWQGVRMDTHQVRFNLDAFEAAHCEDFYYHMRGLHGDLWEEKPPPWQAAWFIYINKTCFNGLWRVNRKGRLNVPWNRREKCPALYDAGVLDAARDRLRRNTMLDHGHYTRIHIGNYATERTVVYCDPPYIGTWTGYTSNPWTAQDQANLRAWCDAADRCDAAVFVSQPDTPEVRACWHGWRMEPIEAPTSMASRPESRGVRRELLVSNGDWRP